MPSTRRPRAASESCKRARAIEAPLATRAADGESQERLAGGTNDLVKRVSANLGGRSRVLIAHIVIRTGHQKCRANGGLRIVGCQHVPGQVFLNQPIKRAVFVNGTNDIIPKRPDVIDDDVAFESPALSKPNHVQPVSSPAFSIGV